MQSLRDKLLKAGVVSEDAAKKAEAEAKEKAAAKEAAPRREERARDEERPRLGGPDRGGARRGPGGRREGGPPRGEGARRDGGSRPGAPMREDVARARLEAAVPKFAPLPGSAAASRELSRKQLELDRTIREKVLAVEVPVDFGATAFYFTTRKNKLRKLTLTEPQAQLLRDGKLAIVERPDPGEIVHALVPPEVAQELLELSERAVRFLNKPGAAVGFLTDEEIHLRASEAEQPEVAATSAEAPAAGATSDAPASKGAEASASSAAEAAAPAAATWITIKRAPRSGD